MATLKQNSTPASPETAPRPGNLAAAQAKAEALNDDALAIEPQAIVTASDEPARSLHEQDGLPAGQRFKALAAMFTAVTLATLDTAISNTALPTIAASLGTDQASVIWVVNGYQLAMVACLLPFASLGETRGHRSVYMFGMILFTVASLFCGVAPNLVSLTIARALQGIGAAAIMSVNAALIRHVFPARMLGRGVGLNALVVAVSFTVGPTVASAILSVAHWPWLFLVNVPIGILSIVLGRKSLPQTDRSLHRFDPTGALLCAALFALLVLGLGTIAQGGGWRSAGLEWLVAVAAGVMLVRRQASHPAPLLPVDLLQRPVFALSALTSICAFSTQGLAFVSLPFLLQEVHGFSQIDTGFLITPWPAIVAVMAIVAGRLSDHYSPGALGGLGLLALSIGMLLLAVMPEHASTVDIVWRLALCGAGFGFFQAPNLKALMGSVPKARAGGASGVVSTCRLLGQTLGAALVALCFHVSSQSGAQLALYTGCGFAFVGSVMSGLRLLKP